MPLEVAAEKRGPSISALSVSTILLLSLSAIWCVVWFVHSWGYWEDDAYIHLEFARSLVTGHGFAFNGRVVYGDTSPLWVFLLIAIHRLVPDYMVAGKVLAALGVVFAITGAYFFSRRMTASTPSGSQTFAAAMVLLVVVNPYFCYWAFSGMETVAAAGLTFWCLVAASCDRVSLGRFLFACLLAGVAPLLRPEMIFFTALLSIVLLYHWYILIAVKPLFQKTTSFCAGLFLLSAPTVLWATYALHTFGRVVPNTNAAKRAAWDASVPLRLLNVYSLGFPLIILGLLAGAIYLSLNFSGLRRGFQPFGQLHLPALAAWVFGLWTLVSAVFYVMDHTLVQTRYILPTAFGLLIVILALTRAVSPRICNYAVAAGLALALGLSVSLWLFIRNKESYERIVANMAIYVRNNTPANVSVADYSIGQIAFLSQHPILDTGGITRPEVAAFLRDNAKILAWVQSEGAGYYVTDEQPAPGAVLVFEEPTPSFGWYLNFRRYSDMDRVRLWKFASPALHVHAPLNSR